MTENGFHDGTNTPRVLLQEAGNLTEGEVGHLQAPIAGYLSVGFFEISRDFKKSVIFQGVECVWGHMKGSKGFFWFGFSRQIKSW